VKKRLTIALAAVVFVAAAATSLAVAGSYQRARAGDCGRRAAGL
jgi:hypothetical protein